jgi:hypothetical protein
MGKGAIILVLSSKLHPASQHIRTMWPNVTKDYRVENLVVLCQEIKKINRRDQMAIIMKHEAFQKDGENIKLYASQPFCSLMREGDPNYFFTSGQPEEFSGRRTQDIPQRDSGHI